jgi:hypothetical protein
MDFLFFLKDLWKTFSNPNFQNFRATHFILNFKVCKFITKNFQKAFSQENLYEERSFWKFLVMNLQTLKFNIKWVALKFWKFGFEKVFQRSFKKKYKIHILGGRQKPYSDLFLVLKHCAPRIWNPLTLDHPLCFLVHWKRAQKVTVINKLSHLQSIV